MKSVSQIETPRLSGRRPQADDFELLRQMHQNSQVMATLGGMRTTAQSQEYLHSHLEHWNRHGFGLWEWFETASGHFVGHGGLRRVLFEQQDQVELAYALLPEFWNQGLATEIAQASVNVAFQNLGLPELISYTLPTNLASRRVMEKCGFTFERDTVWADLPHVLYRLKR